MKLIPLTQGEFAKVDDSDFDYLNQWKWYCSSERKNKYALRREYQEGGKGKSKMIKMHRLLLEVTDSKILVDHKDQNGLNNQRSNIRIATSQQNIRNRGPEIGSTSKYKGVYRRYGRSTYRGVKYVYTYWCAGITVNSKEIILGLFKYNEEGEIEAAKKYDEAAKEHFKEFANLNFK